MLPFIEWLYIVRTSNWNLFDFMKYFYLDISLTKVVDSTRSFKAVECASLPTYLNIILIRFNKKAFHSPFTLSLKGTLYHSIYKFYL